MRSCRRVRACWYRFSTNKAQACSHVISKRVRMAAMHAVLDLLLRPFNSVSALIGAGGWVLPWIFAIALLMWTLIAERWLYFRRTFPAKPAALPAPWRGGGAREGRRWGE